jgi:FtsP/CotA-like multicopper oxidase with cupredoxin domain
MLTIFKTEYTHTEYSSYLSALYHIPPDFLPVGNNLINGRMPFDCKLAGTKHCDSHNAPMTSFMFRTGKVHLLRLINTGGAGIQKFSIDNHDLLVISNDFVPIQPYKTQVVTLGRGQRSDVLDRGIAAPTDSAWMRSELEVVCLNLTAYQPNATAAVYYED